MCPHESPFLSGTGAAPSSAAMGNPPAPLSPLPLFVSSCPAPRVPDDPDLCPLSPLVLERVKTYPESHELCPSAKSTPPAFDPPLALPPLPSPRSTGDDCSKCQACFKEAPLQPTVSRPLMIPEHACQPSELCSDCRHQKLLYERATWRMYRRISSSRDQAESLEQAEESAGENDTTSPPGASAAVAAVPPPPPSAPASPSSSSSDSADDLLFSFDD